MKALILLPNWVRYLGGSLVSGSLALRVYIEISQSFGDEFIATVSNGDAYFFFLAAGLFCLSTHREIIEDERVAYLRARAWQWAAFVFGLGFILTYSFFITDAILLVMPKEKSSVLPDELSIAIELLNLQIVIFLGLFLIRFRLFLYHDRRKAITADAV